MKKQNKAKSVIRRIALNCYYSPPGRLITTLLIAVASIYGVSLFLGYTYQQFAPSAVIGVSDFFLVYQSLAFSALYALLAFAVQFSLRPRVDKEQERFDELSREMKAVKTELQEIKALLSAKP